MNRQLFFKKINLFNSLLEGLTPVSILYNQSMALFFALNHAFFCHKLKNDQKREGRLIFIKGNNPKILAFLMAFSMYRCCFEVTRVSRRGKIFPSPVIHFRSKDTFL